MSAENSPPLVLTDEFTDALARLEAGSNLFLTGKAGTGKSTLIRTFLKNSNRQVIVAAPTGIAALNVGGYTLHRLFSFPTGVSPEYAASAQYYPGRFAEVLRGLDTLIIDEISMVRADLMDAIAIALQRFGPWPGRPFGGVQVVLVGDLYQLPPVVTPGEQDFFRSRYSSPYFFDADAYLSSPFPTVELTTVFRQIGDDELISILNHAREGTLLEQARATLNTRTMPDFQPPPEEMWLTLTTTNRMAQLRNRQMLEQIEAPLITSTADIRGDISRFDPPTDVDLQFKVGAQVMMLNNDPSDRWVNGTIGQIDGHYYGEYGITALVRLPDGSRVSVTPHTWEVTQPTVVGGQLRHEPVGTFTQLPFRLAWAITIHKSQGQTLDRVIVDLTGGTFSDGQLYVALSRCTSMEGLVLRRSVIPKDLKVDPRIRRFLHAGSAQQARGLVYLAMNFVGTVGSKWRPRPIEIAAITEDGQEFSTLINPQMDVGAARTVFGISASHVQLAPTLAQAWPWLSRIIAGRIPVAAGVDEMLGWGDFELKRSGLVVPMPVGIDAHHLGVQLDPPLPPPHSALDQARRLFRAGQEVAGGAGLWQWVLGDDAPSGTPFGSPSAKAGYAMRRVLGESGEVAVEFSVAHALGPAQDPAPTPAEVLAEVLAAGGPWDEAHLDAANRQVLAEVERLSGRTIMERPEASPMATIDAVFSTGSRVCFTGTAQDDTGQEISRSALENLARAQGLEPVANVTKSRCDVLVVADPGTQSGKARKARQWGKPIFSVAEFCAWAGASEQFGLHAQQAISPELPAISVQISATPGLVPHAS